MFQFVGNFKKLELKGARFSEAFTKSLDVQMRQAAREFLRAVIVRVPVYTGMARGSLVPLGRFLRVAVPIKTDVGAKKHPGKSAAIGAANSAFSFTNQGGFNPKLRLDVGVLHFKLNESRPSSLPLRHPTPWRAFQAGQAAFQEYLRRNLIKRVPRVKDFITVSKVTIR